MSERKRFDRGNTLILNNDVATDGDNSNQEVNLTKKVKLIVDSKMPEEQKQSYLKQIGAIKEESYEGKVSFGVYAKARKVETGRHLAMKAYPKAKSVRLATLEEWDKIFKEF